MAAPQAPARRSDGRFRAQFRKTELCAYFARGWCSKGGQCEFAHGEAELQIAPDLTKTSLCRRWLKYQCTLSSEECPFAHGKHELRATPAYVPTPSRQRGVRQAAAQQHSAWWVGSDSSDRGVPSSADLRPRVALQPAVPYPVGQAYGSPTECWPLVVAHPPVPVGPGGAGQCGASMPVGPLIPSAAATVTPVQLLLPPASPALPPPPTAMPLLAPFMVEKSPSTDEAQQLTVNRTCAEPLAKAPAQAASSSPEFAQAQQLSVNRTCAALLAKAASQAVSPTPESVQAILLEAVPDLYED